MARKDRSIVSIKNDILTSRLYVEEGKLIVIQNNSERVVYEGVDFFDLTIEGTTLILNFSVLDESEKYDHSLDLSFVNNVNQVNVQLQ
ncbi:hypothetical protein [uncultured Vagococcus sp.]|uniref:hypothetical protein n=1 Tax=uncultured Vagococcus sp. TaxID=189676 RepID=UPI0028D6FB78|nr:hypothetical protein [uncultured Vagococcus sp.]